MVAYLNGNRVVFQCEFSIVANTLIQENIYAVTNLGTAVRQAVILSPLCEG